jgi:hypothetical protein
MDFLVELVATALGTFLGGFLLVVTVGYLSTRAERLQREAILRELEIARVREETRIKNYASMES